MYRSMAMAAMLLTTGLAAGGAQAGNVTVECVSNNRQYNECQAPLSAPQLVYQSSKRPCIVNRTWGFNPTTRRIWVNDGCKGVFADPAGYHHGHSGNADTNARRYDQQGRDTGALLAGALVGALLIDAAVGTDHATSNHHKHTGKKGSGYTGCHGKGCLVDDPYERSDAPPEPSRGQPTFSSGPGN